ncbi:anti-anti simga factor protein [Sorangium cellulosum]|uniref:Anti-anti simga factor protein n=1 Tax=Sorangium cellulosum TaxID=56 RepID=A0A2L0EVK5_SORCE|nr:PAS domain-containing protein [Sorangium cellulosum]AUX43331.1 anti-anti simga factor protein [Sorangium cellulosum]
MDNRLASVSCTTLLNGTPTPLALLSGTGEVVACNPAWEQCVGPPGLVLDRVHEDDRGELSARLTAARDAAGSISAGARLVDARGEVIPLRWTLWRADDAGLWAAVKPDREAWETQARVLVDVFQTMDAVIWACDRAGTLRVSDGNGLAHFGIKPGQLVGMSMRDLYGEGAQVLDLCKRVLAGETVRTDTVADGVHWIVHYAPRRGDDGEIDGVQTFGINLADHVTLAAQAELLRTCIDSMPIIIWAFDKDGICMVAQGGALAQVDAIERNGIGKHMLELCGDTGEVRAAFQLALSGEIAHAEQLRHDRIWRTRFVPQKDVLGEIIGVGAISEDVTQQRRVDQQLREQLRLTQDQQESIARLSSPIIEVWQDVLIVPLIGAVDADRAAMVMDSLLASVVERQASFAILDLTGLDSVDTTTAQHLIKIINGLTLLGCRGVVTGIRPPVAQTMVGLGFDLSQVCTLRSLKEALRWCMREARRG